jgi:hypothetical protein
MQQRGDGTYSPGFAADALIEGLGVAFSLDGSFLSARANTEGVSQLPQFSRLLALPQAF